MSRHALDPSSLQVQSFALENPQLVAPTRPGGETYPDCPTATGCTCIETCYPGGCPNTV